MQHLWLVPVLCDLALALPARSESGLVRRDIAWKDLHPGHRLLAIIDYLEGIGSDDPGLEDGGVYGSLVREICEHFGWNTPETGARAVLESERFDPLHAHFFGRAARLRLRSPKILLQPFVDPHRVNIYLELGPVPHMVFADGYRAFDFGPPEVRADLERAMMHEAIFDAMFRRPLITCAYKSCGLECGLPQHEHCDDRLHDANAAVCAVARDFYEQLAVWSLF